jgi:hypothetical protein
MGPRARDQTISTSPVVQQMGQPLSVTNAASPSAIEAAVAAVPADLANEMASQIAPNPNTPRAACSKSVLLANILCPHALQSRPRRLDQLEEPNVDLRPAIAQAG